MNAARKPLPDVYNIHARGMGNLMVTLKEQTQNVMPAFAAAKAELLAVAGRMTPDMFDDIQVVKTHVFPPGDR